MGENEHRAHDPGEWRASRSGPWAAVDAGLLRHPKVERLHRAQARLLYLALILHCADELTDGLVSDACLPRLMQSTGARRPDLEALENVGLISRESDENLTGICGEWRVNGYLDWNPSRAHWERQREANARRQAEWRDRQREHATRSNASRNALRNGLVSGEREKYESKELSKGPSRTPRDCPMCGVRLLVGTSLADHLRLVHDVEHADVASP